ncbi:MAG: methionyl-tRNA formyltransferase [Candidatus Peregrinibacteria bacterium]|nr:methionyl-tRNA formyltransferase [Candidatus Peregrinibacteria bacterium]
MPTAPRTIVFCGTSAFALPTLSALALAPDFRIALVITQPDKPVGRKGDMTPPPVKILAQECSLPIAQPTNFNKEFEAVTDGIAQPDFLVVVSYGQILSTKVLAFPRIAPLNVHASLLPRWRGASPIHHAVLAGDKVSGVTVQRMVRELDAGPILTQRGVTLSDRETTATLSLRLADAGAQLLLETLRHLPEEERAQDANRVTLCKKFKREDGKIDPATMSAVEIDRHVRALVPWPGVTVTIDGHELKILETALAETENALAVPCAEDSTIYLVSVQPPGKKPMSGMSWRRGTRGE